MNLGVLLARTGRHADAIRHFQTAAELSPRNVDAVYNWATASMELNKPQEAELLYARALDLAPAHAGSHLYLGELMRRDNRLPEAEQHFRRRGAATRRVTPADGTRSPGSSPPAAAPRPSIPPSAPAS
jgi:tetratricopeptide (TPR) repeat protein